MKRVLPRSLFGRTLLIVLVPLVVVQVVALQIFYGTHLDIVSHRLAEAVAGDIAATVHMVERMPDPPARGWALREALVSYDLSAVWQPGATLPPWRTPRRLFLRHLGLASDLRSRIAAPFSIDWRSDPDAVLVSVRMPGGVLRIAAPRKRLYAATFVVFFAWLVGSSALLFAIAAAFLRNLGGASGGRAGAAAALGRGRDPGPIRPEGAAEVRQAALAFNRMRERLSRFLQQRTEMLAGVSHDLRTPLTRLKLALALLSAPAPDIAGMATDVAEMEALIDTYLVFARGEGVEQAQPTDLAPLLAGIAEHARRAGTAVALSTPPSLVLLLRADAVRRAVTNLVDNARRHASHIALAAARLGTRAVTVTVDDDGPGIAPAARETAFRPFESGDAGGTGLGLAIARDIVRAHGGEITLEDSPLGGLRARIVLPV